MRPKGLEKQSAAALFDLPCACQNLRRVTRVVTRIYDQELRKAGFEITQFGLLTALAATGEANQKRLSAGFAMDSTTLTRTLGLLLKQGWVRVRRGKDRRERLFRLTQAGKRQLAEAQWYWERAEAAVSPAQATDRGEFGYGMTSAYAEYEQERHAAGWMDFSSMLADAVQSLEKPAVRARWQPQYLIVDEAQDTDNCHPPGTLVRKLSQKRWSKGSKGLGRDTH